MHARAAVDHQTVISEVFGEIMPGSRGKAKRRAAVALKPARYFYPSDIVFNRMVGARLRDQHPVAVAQRMLRQLCGPAWQPTEVLLARREPENRAMFQQFFQAPLRFNAAHYALVFPARWLAHPLAAADAGLHGQLRRQADALAARYRGDVPDQVRRVLRMASTMAPMRPMGSTALHEVAAALSVHARTLGRRLNAAGTSFQALVDEDRFEQSRQLLENSTVAVNEIAASLDYADASAFIRAFRRWTGTTPGDWRDTRAQARRRSVNRSSD